MKVELNLKELNLIWDGLYGRNAQGVEKEKHEQYKKLMTKIKDCSDKLEKLYSNMGN